MRADPLPPAVMHLRQAPSANAIGGANRVVWNLVRGMDPARWQARACFLIPAPRGQTTRIDRVEGDGTTWFESRGRRFFDRRQLDQLIEMVRAQGVALLHCHDYKSNFTALRIRRRLPHLRMVTTIHGYIENSLKSRLYCECDRRLFVPHFDRILPVASAQRALFPESCRDRMRVVHNALDPEQWRPALPERLADAEAGRPFRIGFAGRISPEKGWREFADIACQMAGRPAEPPESAKPSVQFRVAGDGPDRPRMQARVRRLGLADRFEFLGAVSDMRRFYETIDVLLSPSRAEGLPMTHLEANAMGVPVVASDVGGVSDFIQDRHNGFLIEGRSPRAFAAPLLQLMDDPALARRMGKAGRRRIEERFSLSSQIERIEGIYGEILKP